MILFVRGDCMVFLCAKRLYDFLVARGCMIFFGVKRLHDFFLSQEVA